MPNEVKSTTTPVSPSSSKPRQQSSTGSGEQPQPIGVPNTVPGRVEPKNEVKDDGARKTEENDKPLELAVEQKTS